MKWFWEKKEASLEELKQEFKIDFYLYIFILIALIGFANLTFYEINYVGGTIMIGIYALIYDKQLDDIKAKIKKKLKK